MWVPCLILCDTQPSMFQSFLTITWQWVCCAAQADNTVRENKNQVVLGYLSWLTGRCGMKLTCLLCARVGHTHSRLDAVYGMLARAFRYLDQISDSEDAKAKPGLPA